MIPSHSRVASTPPWIRLQPGVERRLQLDRTENTFARLAAEAEGSYVLYVWFRVQGGPKLHPSTVRRACRALQLRHPVLRCVVEKQGYRTFALRESSENEIPVQFHRQATDASAMEYWEQHVNGVTWQAHPLEVHVFDHASTTTTETTTRFDIALRVHHFCCDGPSVFLLADQFFDHLVEGFKYHPAPPSGRHAVTMDDAIDATFRAKNTGHLEFLRNALWYTYNNFSLVLNSHWREVPRAGPKVANAPERQGKTTHLGVVLSEERTLRLVTLCKAKQTSVTAIVGACIQEALSRACMTSRETEGEFGYYVCVVASSRNDTIPAVDPADLSCHTGSFPVMTTKRKWSVNRELGVDELWDLAREFKDKVKAATDDSLKLYNAWWTRNGLALAPMKVGVSFYFSSFGQTSPVKKSYGGGKYRILSGELLQNTPLQPNPSFFAYNVCNRLHVSMSGPRRLYADELIAACVARTEANLARVADHGEASITSKL